MKQGNTLGPGSDDERLVRTSLGEQEVICLFMHQLYADDYASRWYGRDFYNGGKYLLSQKWSLSFLERRGIIFAFFFYRDRCDSKGPVSCHGGVFCVPT